MVSYPGWSVFLQEEENVLDHISYCLWKCHCEIFWEYPLVNIAYHISCFLSKCTKFHGFKSWILKANAHMDINRLCKYELCYNLVTHIETIIYSSIWKKEKQTQTTKKPAQRLLFLFTNLHLENRAYGIMNLWGLIMPQMPAQVTPPSSTKTLDLSFKTFWLYKRTRISWLH